MECETNTEVVLLGKLSGKYTQTEKAIAKIIKKVMWFEELDVYENFSDLGGDSIILIALRDEIEKVFPGKVKIADLFSYNNIHDLGAFLDREEAKVPQVAKKAEGLTTSQRSEGKSGNIMYDRKDIAVIGIALRLPLASSKEEYWKNIEDGRDCITELSQNRKMDISQYLKYMNIMGETRYHKGGYLQEIDTFDYRFFGIAPKEASFMDPNQRMFLQVAVEAIEDSGYNWCSLKGSRTGVFIGFAPQLTTSYGKMVFDTNPLSWQLSAVTTLPAILPSRVSYVLDLKGPSLYVDTACSSSLVSTHLACQAIRNGDCDMAIAGAARLSLLPLDEAEKQLDIESNNYQTRSFDDNSDGLTWGEGIMALLLKPFGKAIEDGDNIYAVIKGTAINQDGASMGITAPSSLAQTDVIVKAWKDAAIDPETISYIETHGTGTPLGDPIEIEGIQQAFKMYTERKQFCAIGSVKPNIGHLDTASGLAGLIKAILALKMKKIPPNIYFDKPNSKINFEESPVYLNNCLTEWETEGTVRRCGVSSFGLSGTNCHIVLEEYNTSSDDKVDDSLQFLTLSAKSKEALQGVIKSYKNSIDRLDEYSLADICYTSSCGRDHYSHRIAIILKNKLDLREKIEKLAVSALESSKDNGVYYGNFTALQYNIAERSLKANNRITEFVYGEKRSEALLREICELYVGGAEIAWNGLYSKEARKKVSLPVYSFEESRCWFDIPRKKRDLVNFGLDEMLNIPNIPATLANEIKTNFEKWQKELQALQGTESDSTGPQITLTGRDHYTEMERRLAQIWCEVLGFNEMDIHDSFYQLGGHSITMMQVITKIRSELGCSINLKDFGARNTIADLGAYLSENQSQTLVPEPSYPNCIPDPERIHVPFPLTEIQMAYFLGREDAFEMGGVSTHVYFEIETKLDINRLQNSMQKLIKRHPMLRAIILPNGLQKILEEVPEYKILTRDLSNMDSNAQSACIVKEREKMSHRVNKTDEWPLIEFKAFKIDQDTHYLLIDIDVLIADGASLQIIGNDLMAYYENPDIELPKLDLTFRDYMLTYQQFKKSELHEADKKYWLKRLADFPLAPALPMKQDPGKVTNAHFKRYSKKYNLQEWQKLKEIAQQLNISPSSLLCTAYAEILSYWSNQSKFAINLTVFNRYPFHKDVNEIIGDFTSVMLIDIDMEQEQSFFDRAKAIQNTLFEALEHRHYDGVEFIRDIAARNNMGAKAVMPIVFTSMLFNGAGLNSWFRMGEFKMGASQTASVYLDQQAVEVGDGMFINWDIAEELFEEDVIEGMFEQYTGLLDYLITTI